MARVRFNEIEMRSLEERVRRAWCRETSVDVDWSPENPAQGQCAVTALVVQDEFGGGLVRCSVGATSHYWNVLPGGREVDLTREQFGAEFSPSKTEARSRSYVLSFPETRRRYALLRERINKAQMGRF